jgi:1-acyl-sn-glycerol-3-phosphate acyltransferase
VLQHVLNRRIPLLKFFLKQQLIWVPVIGLAWWALDFPFMRRHSEAELRKRTPRSASRTDSHAPRLRQVRARAHQRDELRRGHALHPAKHQAQASPYRTCSSPRPAAWRWRWRAGRAFDSLIDVTIVYPDGVPTFWHFLCGTHAAHHPARAPAADSARFLRRRLRGRC